MGWISLHCHLQDLKRYVLIVMIWNTARSLQKGLDRFRFPWTREARFGGLKGILRPWGVRKMIKMVFLTYYAKSYLQKLFHLMHQIGIADWAHEGRDILWFCGIKYVTISVQGRTN